VVRADDRRAMHYETEGLDVAILMPEGPHALQALLTTLSPRAAMKDFIVQPNEIFVLVLEGKVRTEFADGREIVLDAGDSAAFISGEGGHRHTNLSDETTRLVVVISRTHPR
jgi:quercetin dioxygenase-like cupin family protein